MGDVAKGRDSKSTTIEELFQRLPPLDSDSYLQRVRTGSHEELPAEVLVRAFRQLPPKSPAARETLERLFRRTGIKWEYLELLTKLARRQERSQQKRNRGDEYKDILQDAISGILQVLPTDRGAFAETAWHSFCRREFWDAWRRRYGRRGERLGPLKEASEIESEDGESADRLDLMSDTSSLCQAFSHLDRSPQIEAILREVYESFEDPFVKAVAGARWFSDRRPKTAGIPTSDREPPLTHQFPGKSRDQINRACQKADNRLAESLLDDQFLELPTALRSLLEKHKSRGRQ